MLKEIYIENYKSLRNVTVQFKDGLNIIIGKNGSGKSNLLEFIEAAIGREYFFMAYQKANFRSDFRYTYYYQNNVDGPLDEVSVQTRSHGIVDTQIVVVNKGEERVFMHPGKLADVIDFLPASVSFSVLHLRFALPENLIWLEFPTVASFSQVGNGKSIQFEYTTSLLAIKFQHFLERKVYFSSEGIHEKSMQELYDFFQGAFLQFKEQHKISGILRDYSPILDIRLGQNLHKAQVGDLTKIFNLSFDFLVGQQWIPWQFLSDGTKRLFYIIGQILFAEQGLVLIDEPELGIHPHQLYKLMQFLDEQSATKQIIISTHSPIVLDALRSSELDRIIVAKMENGSSKFERLNEEQIKEAKEYMENVNELSYYWLHHSELESHD